MEIREFRALVRWADMATDNAEFWSRLYYAAFSYDVRMRLLLHGLVASFGILPNPASSPTALAASDGDGKALPAQRLRPGS